jgi:hypothetical protein
MKNRLFILLILLLVMIGTATYGADKAKIFCVNLYNGNVDFRLGEEKDPVFFMNGLEAFTATSMYVTDQYGTFTFWFKESTDKSFAFWAKDGKTAEKCEIKAGNNYCFIIGVDGTIKLYYLTEEKTSNPKVCFLNGANSSITRMEVSKGWKKNVAAFTDNLGQNAITNFVSVNPDKYSMYWQFPEHVKTDEYYYYPDKSGKKPEILSFNKSAYFIFLAYTLNREDYAVIWDITPQK